MRLRDRIALVTGASLGIGRRIALDLAVGGATVIGVARRAEALAEVEDEVRAISPDSWTRTVDVAEEQAVRALLADIVERHGRLDILICNAAIEQRTGVEDLDMDTIRRTMRINFEGVVHCVLAALPGMVAHGEGWIVGVSSGVSRAPVPMESAYAASKAAMVAFLESISYEVEPKGVRVKALWPGFVGDTPMARASVAQGLPVPPKIVHRTAEQVSRALLANLDKPGFEINSSKVEMIAPVFRTLMQRPFRRSVARTQGMR